MWLCIRRGGISLVLMVATMAGASPRQLPAQAAAISKQCRAYSGTVCSGIVTYDYLAREGENDDPETTVKEALKRVEVRSV